MWRNQNGAGVDIKKLKTKTHQTQVRIIKLKSALQHRLPTIFTLIAPLRASTGAVAPSADAQRIAECWSWDCGSQCGSLLLNQNTVAQFTTVESCSPHLAHSYSCYMWHKQMHQPTELNQMKITSFWGLPGLHSWQEKVVQYKQEKWASSICKHHVWTTALRLV